MGANAQTTVPTFTASQVLTADQQNQSARTGVPVFATTGTRDAGFGGTGEKTLAEGQLCYVEGTGLQTYNGSSWVTWGAYAPGLVLLSSTTIGSGVSSVNVPNAFNATYENYRITISGGVGSVTQQLLLTLGATATGYYWGVQGATFAGVTSVNGAANTSSWRAGGSSTLILTGVIDLFNPYLANETHYSSAFLLPATSGGVMQNAGGFLNNTTSYTDFTITPDSGTLTGGTIRVYGYQNS